MAVLETPVFPEIDQDKPVPMDAIRFVVARIAARFKPEKIILFGSHAYGEPKPWSDVDLLVIMETERTSREQRLEIARFLRDRTFGIDIIVRKPDELKHRIELGDFFLRELTSKGKVLYERANC